MITRNMMMASALAFAVATVGCGDSAGTKPVNSSNANSAAPGRDTAKVEPKLAALRLMGSPQRTKPVEIVAHGWWLYWPLAYLAGGQSRLSIVPEHVPGGARGSDVRRSWHVSFVNALEDRNREGEVGGEPSLFVM